MTRALFASAIVWLVVAGAVGCGVIADPPSPPGSAVLPALPGQATGQFVTGNATLGGAVNDFFGHREEPVQPIEFPHNTHIQNEIACEMCHEGVTSGARAGIPGLRTCMICHAAIATDKPRIQQITKMSEEGRDLAWQRVYGYPAQAHVRFNHAPHIRNGVECATCHGDLSQQTVARRSGDLDMGFCVTCHNERKASTDCMACHY